MIMGESYLFPGYFPHIMINDFPFLSAVTVGLGWTCADKPGISVRLLSLAGNGYIVYTHISIG